MSIRVTCPGRDAEYTLADRQGGKKVRCKKCATVIAVDAAEEGPGDGSFRRGA